MCDANLHANRVRRTCTRMMPSDPARPGTAVLPPLLIAILAGADTAVADVSRLSSRIPSCATLFPESTTFLGRSRFVDAVTTDDVAEHARMLQGPVAIARSDGATPPTVEELLERHGKDEVDVRNNAQVLGQYGFSVQSGHKMPLEKAMLQVAASEPDQADRELIFTDKRSGVVTAMLDEFVGGAHAADGSTAQAVQALKQHVMMKNVFSYAGSGHGLPWHKHDESWLLLLTGKKRWLIGSPTLGNKLFKQYTASHGVVSQSHSFSWLPETFASVDGVHECMQYPGDIVFLPPQWYHATRNEDGMTIGVGGQVHSPGLHLAAARNDIAAAEALCIEHGAAPSECASLPTLNVVTGMGKTVVHTAAGQGAIDFLKWLKKHGFENWYKIDSGSNSPVQSAALSGKLDTVIWMHTEGGIRPSTGFGPRGRKSIHTAASYGHLHVVEWLVESGGMSVSEADRTGSQPLHLAVAGDQPHIVRWLLEHGASSTALGEGGVTPLVIAKGVAAGPEVVQMLENASAAQEQDDLTTGGKKNKKRKRRNKDGRKRQRPELGDQPAVVVGSSDVDCAA